MFNISHIKCLMIHSEVKENHLLSQQLSEFINDVASFTQHSESSSGGWFWPLVKSVTIKLPDCHELLEHIVLLDLPGTGDCNKIREDLWKSVNIHSFQKNILPYTQRDLMIIRMYFT